MGLFSNKNDTGYYEAQRVRFTGLHKNPVEKALSLLQETKVIQSQHTAFPEHYWSRMGEWVNHIDQLTDVNTHQHGRFFAHDHEDREVIAAVLKTLQYYMENPKDVAHQQKCAEAYALLEPVHQDMVRMGKEYRAMMTHVHELVSGRQAGAQMLAKHAAAHNFTAAVTAAKSELAGVASTR